MHRDYSYHEYQKALLHYSRFGKGEKALLFFHGFGQTSAHFRELEEVFGEEYTIYSFDLFYHGKSFWHERDKPLTKAFWSAMLEDFLKKNSIGKFSLLGFSMGGKFVLATLESMPERIEKITLIAPDGVKTSFWYSLATYPGWIQGFFRKIIINPSLYYKLINFLKFLRLIDKGIVRFANTQMLTREQRRRVYYSWVVFKELQFDMKAISGLINKHQIETEMFLGAYDKIITRKNMYGLLRGVKAHRLHMLQTGHSALISAVAGYYKADKVYEK